MHSRNLIAPPLRIKDREGNLFPAGVAIKNELVQSEIRISLTLKVQHRDRVTLAFDSPDCLSYAIATGA